MQAIRSPRWPSFLFSFMISSAEESIRGKLLGIGCDDEYAKNKSEEMRYQPIRLFGKKYSQATSKADVLGKGNKLVELQPNGENSLATLIGLCHSSSYSSAGNSTFFLPARSFILVSLRPNVFLFYFQLLQFSLFNRLFSRLKIQLRTRWCKKMPRHFQTCFCLLSPHSPKGLWYSKEGGRGVFGVAKANVSNCHAIQCPRPIPFLFSACPRDRERRHTQRSKAEYSSAGVLYTISVARKLERSYSTISQVCCHSANNLLS